MSSLFSGGFGAGFGSGSFGSGSFGGGFGSGIDTSPRLTALEQALLRKRLREQKLRGKVSPDDDGFLDMLTDNIVAKALGQIGTALIYTPAGIAHMGVGIGRDVSDLARRGDITPERTFGLAEETGRAIYEDFRHPLRNPGYLALDVFGLGTFGASTVARAAAVPGIAARRAAARAARLEPPSDPFNPTGVPEGPRPSPLPPTPTTQLVDVMAQMKQAADRIAPQQAYLEEMQGRVFGKAFDVERELRRAPEGITYEQGQMVPISEVVKGRAQQATNLQELQKELERVQRKEEKKVRLAETEAQLLGPERVQQLQRVRQEAAQLSPEELDVAYQGLAGVPEDVLAKLRGTALSIAQLKEVSRRLRGGGHRAATPATRKPKAAEQVVSEELPLARQIVEEAKSGEPEPAAFFDEFEDLLEEGKLPDWHPSLKSAAIGARRHMVKGKKPLKQLSKEEAIQEINDAALVNRIMGKDREGKPKSEATILEQLQKAAGASRLEPVVESVSKMFEVKSDPSGKSVYVTYRGQTTPIKALFERSEKDKMVYRVYEGDEAVGPELFFDREAPKFVDKEGEAPVQKAVEPPPNFAYQLGKLNREYTKLEDAFKKAKPGSKLSKSIRREMDKIREHQRALNAEMAKGQKLKGEQRELSPDEIAAQDFTRRETQFVFPRAMKPTLKTHAAERLLGEKYTSLEWGEETRFERRQHGKYIEKERKKAEAEAAAQKAEEAKSFVDLDDPEAAALADKFAEQAMKEGLTGENALLDAIAKTAAVNEIKPAPKKKKTAKPRKRQVPELGKLAKDQAEEVKALQDEGWVLFDSEDSKLGASYDAEAGSTGKLVKMHPPGLRPEDGVSVALNEDGITVGDSATHYNQLKRYGTKEELDAFVAERRASTDAKQAIEQGQADKPLTAEQKDVVDSATLDLQGVFTTEVVRGPRGERKPRGGGRAEGVAPRQLGISPRDFMNALGVEKGQAMEVYSEVQGPIVKMYKEAKARGKKPKWAMVEQVLKDALKRFPDNRVQAALYHARQMWEKAKGEEGELGLPQRGPKQPKQPNLGPTVDDYMAAIFEAFTTRPYQGAMRIAYTEELPFERMEGLNLFDPDPYFVKGQPGATRISEIPLSNNPLNRAAQRWFYGWLNKYTDPGATGKGAKFARGQLRRKVAFEERELERIRDAARKVIPLTEADLKAELARMDKSYNKASISAWIDSLNDFQRLAVLYLKPAYLAPNMAGQVFLSLVDHGWNPVALHRTVKTQRHLYGDKELAGQRAMKIRAAMDSGMVNTLDTGRGALGWLDRTTDLLQRQYSKLLDTPFRDNAFIHEAHRAGYRTPEQVARLVDNYTPDANLEAPGEFFSARMQRDFELIARRANRNMIDYGRMTRTEKNILRRIVFFYPWIKNASIYGARFVAEHPYQAMTLQAQGKLAEDREVEELGMLPSYVKGAIKVGERTVPGLGKVPTVVNPQAASVLGTPGTSLLMLKQALAGGGLKAFEGGELLNPTATAAIAAMTGVDPFTGSKFEGGASGVERFLTEFLKSPAFVRVGKSLEKARKQEEGTLKSEELLYPQNQAEAWSPFLGPGLGALVGKPFGERALNPLVARERAAEEERSVAGKRQAKLMLYKQKRDRLLEEARRVGFVAKNAKSLPKPLEDAIALKGAREASQIELRDALGKSDLLPQEKLFADLRVLVRRGKIPEARARQYLEAMTGQTEQQVETFRRRIASIYFRNDVYSIFKARLELKGAEIPAGL